MTCVLLASLIPASHAYAQEKPNRKVLVKYSLFYEYYKNNSYKSASPHLRWLLEHAPTYRGDMNWERAVRMYEGLAEKASGTAASKAYLDSALTVIDRIVTPGSMKRQRSGNRRASC